MHNFIKIKLKSLIELITDYHANGSYKILKSNVTIKYHKDYAIMIRTLNFEQQNFYSDLIYVDEKAYNFLSKSKVFPYDILINKIANPGSVYMMPDINAKITCGMNLFLIRFSNQVDQIYMYYHLKHNENKIKNLAHGTTTKTITKDDIRDFETIIHSDIKIQNKISALLHNLDKLIEKQNLIYSELEKMAKTLYDYWFVQFDFPDENGRPYKSSGGKMVWSEELQREIPYGWEVHSLTKYCYFYNGYAFSSSTYCDNGKYKVYTIKNITNYGIDATNCSFINDIPQRMNNECILKPGDILLTLTGHVGRVGIVFETNALLNQRVLKLVSNHQILLYLILIDKNINKQIVNKANGSSQKNLSPNILHDILYPYPSQNIINKFTKQYDNIYNKLILIKQKNQELTSLRDFLLPLLMNGQAVIKE